MTANHRPLEEGDIELIDRIRATPSLYDTRDPDFRLVYKKDQYWQMIADNLEMSHWEARKRWTVLRDRYARELKQLLLHPDSMEYGKNEFFHRMDFLRNFVKKRRVRQKRYNSQGEEIDEEINKQRPIKIAKIDNVNSFEIFACQEQQDQKTYIIEDSQDSSNGKFSYVDQTSQEEHHHQQLEQQNDNHLVEHDVENEYQDYVEDVSVPYEAVVMDPDLHSHNVSNHSTVTATTTSGNSLQPKPVVAMPPKIIENYCITTLNDDKSFILPNLQQKPTLQVAACSQAAPSTSSSSSTNDQNEIEDYFSKTIASYLKQLSRRHKIKAKVEMMQILEKYIDLEEAEKNLKYS